MNRETDSAYIASVLGILGYKRVRLDVDNNTKLRTTGIRHWLGLDDKVFCIIFDSSNNSIIYGEPKDTK